MVFLFFRKFLIQFFKLFIKKASARTPAGTEDVKARQKKVSPITIGNCSLPHGNTTPSAQAYVPKEYDRSPDLGYRGPPSPRRAPFSGCLPNGFWRPFFRYSNGCCSGFTPDSLLSSGKTFPFASYSVRLFTRHGDDSPYRFYDYIITRGKYLPVFSLSLSTEKTFFRRFCFL